MNYTDFKLVDVVVNIHGQKSAIAKQFISKGTTLGVFGGNAMSFLVINNQIQSSDIEQREIVQISFSNNTLIGLVSPKNENWSGIDYINHSCNPNVVAIDRIVVNAMEDILQGQELTIDYRTWDFVSEGIQCWCDTPKCFI